MPQAASRRLAVDLTIVLACLALAWAGYVHFSALRAPGPLEYRENAMLLLTDFIGHGGNPYTLENLPLHTSVYGIGYNVLVLPLTKIMGGGYLPHRLVSGVFTIASCVLIGWAIQRAGAARAAAFIGAVLLYLDLAARSTTTMAPASLPECIIARPDGMGEFLFIISLLLPWRFDFSKRSLLASMVIAMVAFLTKPYFMLGFGIVAAYVFFFRSMRLGAVAGLVGTMIFAAVVGVATWLGPCYFNIVIAANRASASGLISHLIEQVIYYIRSLPGCICLASVVVLRALRRFQQSSAADSPTPSGRPLRIWNVDFFHFATACVLLALCLKLGRHGGNSMLYFYQLLSPLMLIVAISWIGQPARWGSAGTWLLTADLALFLLARPIAPSPHSDLWTHQWPSLLEGKKLAYVAPPLAWIEHEHGLPIYDTGMTEYFSYTKDVSVYPSQTLMDDRAHQFVDDLFQATYYQDLDILVLPFDGDTPLSMSLQQSLVPQKYREVADLSFGMDWEPKMKGVVFERIPQAAVK